MPFGTYVEAHDDPMVTNDSKPRTTPEIALGPTGNAQGTYKFLSLTTGQKIKRREWTKMSSTRLCDKEGGTAGGT